MNKKINKILLVLLAILVSLFFIIPILWMVSTSLKTDAEAYSSIIHWFPERPTLANYIYTLFENTNETPVLGWLANSIFVGVSGSLLVVIIDALAAYALARLEFPFRKIIFGMFLATMMIPFIVIFLPLYLEFNNFNLLDTYWALILPYTSNAFGVFLLRQFFLTIPKDIEEAAMIDGANKFKIFLTIMLPLVHPALLTLGIFTFISIYNDFLWPLVVTSSPEMRTVSVGIAIMQLGSFVSSPSKLMALTTIATIPMLIVFIFAQKYFVQGITFSGGKE
ncbi:carbohydrate ABC transporter permease [Tepidibacillus infernus]|uniref:carbohydrate ABC transporter permease n=1 Tax=Tepidibacillus TaxID=1494427 RepID=UPI000853C654|nr:carbohydrate ABC transporter permease [Tepidibacillus sp. HK-1]GBF10438.1 L-arabinose transport system permease protein AraQ [Tepidibacillus sp. HK-1]